MYNSDSADEYEVVGLGSHFAGGWVVGDGEFLEVGDEEGAAFEDECYVEDALEAEEQGVGFGYWGDLSVRHKE